MTDETQQPFYYDEFFADENDPGVEVRIRIRGRDVPIFLKRGITLEDKLACQALALKKRVVGGQLIVDGVDERRMVEELLIRMIVSWPFVTRAGEPVPVTRESIRKLLGGADQLAAAIEKMETEGAAALDPFVSPSAAASATAESDAPISLPVLSPSA